MVRFGLLIPTTIVRGQETIPTSFQSTAFSPDTGSASSILSTSSGFVSLNSQGVGYGVNLDTSTFDQSPAFGNNDVLFSNFRPSTSKLSDYLDDKSGILPLQNGLVNNSPIGGHSGSMAVPQALSTCSDSIQPRQRRKVPEGELCAVCSDRATGYHYGVASCNGCKTFFRRTIVSEHTFVCQYNGKCDVNKNVRCACRHCRFNKCVAVGMDARAIQNDRDRIGPTKKMRMMKRNSSAEDDRYSNGSMSPVMKAGDDKIIEYLHSAEKMCNLLRTKELVQPKNVKEALSTQSLLLQANNLQVDVYTVFRELYPASMVDIQKWNIRELVLCIEWAKSFEEFVKMAESDQYYLMRNFAFTFNILNRVYYSLDYGPDKIVYPNGAYILRQSQDSLKIPGCRSIYHRQMDEIMMPLRKLDIGIPEFAAFKACLLFNPDALELSLDVKEDVARVRTKYLNSLFHILTQRHGISLGAQKYGQMLIMSSSIQNIVDTNDENMQIMDVFGNFWRINAFVKELCMK
ncbi:unnamed protein product [Bursaphelenchus okinawaensis]|uniref:Uncharacterized protein n=1 Tax=Bursaphelenchus okinawaensis TaxID=465554 RepID=A0A811KH20_9BILA|nr:unnamed protein product [Bursaphelenchus okinawaensis]CAG9103167.1 unnamed protein product [Bursaphelenchus okinawaensis]